MSLCFYTHVTRAQLSGLGMLISRQKPHGGRRGFSACPWEPCSLASAWLLGLGKQAGKHSSALLLPSQQHLFINCCETISKWPLSVWMPERDAELGSAVEEDGSPLFWECACEGGGKRACLTGLAFLSTYCRWGLYYFQSRLNSFQQLLPSKGHVWSSWQMESLLAGISHEQAVLRVSMNPGLNLWAFSR